MLIGENRINKKMYRLPIDGVMRIFCEECYNTLKSKRAGKTRRNYFKKHSGNDKK